MAIWSRFDGEFTGIKIRGKKTGPTWGILIPYWSGLVRFLTWDDVVTVNVEPPIARQGYRVVYRQAGGIAIVSELVYHRHVQVNIGPQACAIAVLSSSGEEIADIAGPEEFAAARAASKDEKPVVGTESEPRPLSVSSVRIGDREGRGQEIYLDTPLL